MKNNNTTSSSRIGFSSVLFIAFLVLKLTNIINWSWWWITAPLWIPFGLAILALILMAIVSKN